MKHQPQAKFLRSEIRKLDQAREVLIVQHCALLKQADAINARYAVVRAEIASAIAEGDKTAQVAIAARCAALKAELAAVTVQQRPIELELARNNQEAARHLRELQHELAGTQGDDELFYLKVIEELVKRVRAEHEVCLTNAEALAMRKLAVVNKNLVAKPVKARVKRTADSLDVLDSFKGKVI